MKHLCCNKTFLILFFSLTTLFASLHDKSAIVYYGKNISYPAVGIHDYIIVEPKNTNVHTSGFAVYKKNMYAYLSVGEIREEEREEIDKRWIIGNNSAWGSTILDLRNPDYFDYLLHVKVQKLFASGFTNLFLDTLDSYRIALRQKEERDAYKKALIRFIRAIKSEHPESKIILNRGFEIIDDIHDAITAVLFESYLYGLSGDVKSYREVSEKERRWLDVQIEKIQRYDLDIIDIEYLDGKDIDKYAARILKKAKKRGIIPYISDKTLDIYGVSSKNAFKREILFLYSAKTNDKGDNAAHLYGSTIVEYLGYVPRLKDIDAIDTDTTHYRNYAGVVVWSEKNADEPTKLFTLVKNLNNDLGIKTLFVESFNAPFDKAIFNLLDIDLHPAAAATRLTIDHVDSSFGFEAQPLAQHHDALFTPKDAKTLFSLKDSNGNKTVLSAVTPWGGYSIAESSMISFNDENVWIADPFKLFTDTLRLQTIPAPDVTTRYGRRIFFTHIDGDGMVSKVEFNPQLFSGDIIYEEVLKHYKVPHSVSLVGAETMKNGKYPQYSEHLENIARKIYALPNVESATHTFSHPYHWGEIHDNNLDEKYRMKIDNYKFDLDYEIGGMIRHIHATLLPPGKKNKPMVFWSGDCMPLEETLDYIYKHKILNMNAGDTTISNDKPWLSLVAPLGLARGEYRQVYTGAQNENVYTNDWLGPFWGFKKALQTFQLTDKPRRLKPINIYYHFYSGSKRASLNALHTLFKWALQQSINPIYASEYIPIVLEFYTISMANDKNRWLVAGAKKLKTLRAKKSMGDVLFNDTVIGKYPYNDSNYIALYPSFFNYIQFVPHNDDKTYLLSTNGDIVKYKRDKKSIDFTVASHVPVSLEYSLAKSCAISTNIRPIKLEKKAHIRRFQFDTKRVNFHVTCK